MRASFLMRTSSLDCREFFCWRVGFAGARLVGNLHDSKILLRVVEWNRRACRGLINRVQREGFD
jgi:hypothetical protein